MARKKRKNLGWRGQLLLIFAALSAIAAVPTTVMLFFGLLPTAVAVFIDRTREGTRALCVGAMNIAGCSPFIFQLWTGGHTVENAVSIITDPRTIIVMYSAAGVGYIIDWTISGLVGGVMVQRAQAKRQQNIKIQKSMVERWGREVTGEIPVDSQGFPIGGEASADHS